MISTSPDLAAVSVFFGRSAISACASALISPFVYSCVETAHPSVFVHRLRALAYKQLFCAPWLDPLIARGRAGKTVADMSKAAIERQKSLECTPVRRRSGTSPEGELEMVVCKLQVVGTYVQGFPVGYMA